MIENIIFKFSPFSTVIIRPLKRASVGVLSSVGESKSYQLTKGRYDIEIPTGQSAEVFIEGNNFRVDDYRDRPGHTPGARVVGKGVDIKLDNNKNTANDFRIGNIYYSSE